MNNNEAISLLQDAADRADAFLELAQLAATDARAIARLLKEQEVRELTMDEWQEWKKSKTKSHM